MLQRESSVYEAAALAGSSMVADAGPTIEVALWYWEETANVISKHHPSTIVDKLFVAYAGSVCKELDKAYYSTSSTVYL